MPSFAMLKKLSTETLTRPESIKKLNRQVQEYLEDKCPQVRWIAHYGLLGNARPKFLCEEPDGAEEICVYDYLDVFEAPDHITASKVASIVRSFGHSTVELWCDMSLDRITDLLGNMTGGRNRQSELELMTSRKKLKQPLLF